MFINIVFKTLNVHTKKTSIKINCEKIKSGQISLSFYIWQWLLYHTDIRGSNCCREFGRIHVLEFKTSISYLHEFNVTCATTFDTCMLIKECLRSPWWQAKLTASMSPSVAGLGWAFCLVLIPVSSSRSCSISSLL